MAWLPYFSLLATSVSPVSSATGDFVTYIVSFGVLGIAAVLFVLRIIVPRSAVDDAIKAARADLVAENLRLITEKQAAEAQRDAALKIAQEQVVPLLTSFVGTTSALLPLLQDLVAMREELRRSTRRDRDG